MSAKEFKTDSRTAVDHLLSRLQEDPNREPHEKETVIHLQGDGEHLTITSFKRVVYEKLLRRPEFEVTALHVLAEGRERAVPSVEEVAADPSMIVIGVSGRLPVGCFSLGSGRKSNSHAQIVK